MMMTSFKFVICEGADTRHFKATQIREDSGANYAAHHAESTLWDPAAAANNLNGHRVSNPSIRE